MLDALLGLQLARSMPPAPDCTAPQQVRDLPPPAAPQRASQPTLPPIAAGEDYRHLLRPTPLGWPLRHHWCVWIDPLQQVDGSGEAARQQLWRQAVVAALKTWSELVPWQLVDSPEQAQIRIWRRRPPLQRLADGRTRASHGRSLLTLLQVQRSERWQIEPRVEVLLSPGQAPLPLQATALHELGHAFGLWGHSDDPADAMAAAPTARPVLRLSARDRATMRWLRDVKLLEGLTPSEPLHVQGP